MECGLGALESLVYFRSESQAPDMNISEAAQNKASRDFFAPVTFPPTEPSLGERTGNPKLTEIQTSTPL